MAKCFLKQIQLWNSTLDALKWLSSFSTFWIKLNLTEETFEKWKIKFKLNIYSQLAKIWVKGMLSFSLYYITFIYLYEDWRLNLKKCLCVQQIQNFLRENIAFVLEPKELLRCYSDALTQVWILLSFFLY